jgi:hypothetical protein
MSSEEAKEAELDSIEGLASSICVCPSPPSPSRFNSLVKNLRQKLHSEVVPSAHMNEDGAILQETMDDVACLSRLLRISEANLVEERASTLAAHIQIQDLQQQLQTVTNDSTAHLLVASQLKSELERSQERSSELERDVSALRDALCKSEVYRKDYAKSKKSEMLVMQAKLDSATAEASAQAAAHERTRALLLSEVEARAGAVDTVHKFEYSYAELQDQHKKLQELCKSLEKQSQVNVLTRCNLPQLFYPSLAVILRFFT